MTSLPEQPTSTVHRIDLGQGVHALVDRADAEMVAGFRWKLSADGYVHADRFSMRIHLHRLIAGAGDKELVDHANCDPLDNRSANLRVATKSQNGANRGPDRRRYGTSSKYKGVSWSRHRDRWRAYIHVNGRTRYLGTYLSEDDAARAYNRAALEAWGEFARLNDAPD